MKIAVIGGGASGMAAAYYLSKNGHGVTVYEKQPMLGGHIRTINRNVEVDSLDSGIVLEGGVVEFSSRFTNFIELMDELGVELESMEIGTAILKRDGKRYLSRSMIAWNTGGLSALLEILKLGAVYISATWVWLRTFINRSSHFHDQSFSEYVKEEHVHNTWMKLLVMYCYSIPYRSISKLPAELAISALQAYMWADWMRIKGGVYSYIEKIESLLNGEVVLNAEIKTVTRSDEGIDITLQEEQTEHFDKIVFAVPPDQVLKLLSDPSEKENCYFDRWQENMATTVVHMDPLTYQQFEITQPSQFDFIQTDSGWGYNACLNQICGLSDKIRYHLAYNIESLSDPENIVCKVLHHTPLYTVEDLHWRDGVLASNGENNTYHAGAYLYDGLHEGAVISGKHVAELIGSQV